MDTWSQINGPQTYNGHGAIQMLVATGDKPVGTYALESTLTTLRQGQVPACIQFVKGHLVLSDFARCSHILVCSTLAQASSCINWNLYGVSTKAIILEGAGLNYVYMEVDQYILTTNKSFLALVTRHFNGLYDSINLADPTSLDGLGRDRLPAEQINEPWSKAKILSAEVTKITSSHHEHFYPAESLAATMHLHPGDDALRLPYDATRPMVAGFILWFSVLSAELKDLVRSSGLLKAKDVTTFKKLAKAISAEAKSLQNLAAVDLREIFELDVLVNRVDGEVDWETEKLHRLKPNVTKLSDEEVYDAASKIFTQAGAIKRQPASLNWEKYWASRWQWSASGSVHSQHADDEQYVEKSDRNLKNKFIMISKMPAFGFKHFSARQPALHAWSSIKYEWGKLRAIYGTDTTSYIISNFAFYNCENVLPNRFPVGKDANDLNVLSRVSGVLSQRMPYCLDFEDFNSQHSIGSMKSVIRAYRDVFWQTLTPEQHEAMDWTAQSLENMIIHDNVGTNSIYKAEGTLLSGWRLTTFVNSVLNAVYTDKICAGAKPEGSSLHNGDDVIIGAKSLKVARLSLLNGRKYDIRIQPAKCAFGAIAEFLRVDHRRGSKGQYLSRAIATLMHSRIESKPSTDARDLVESMENRFSDCLTRGMDLQTISVLRHLYYKRQAEICGCSVREMYLIKTTHRVAGGISEAIDSSVEYSVEPGPTKELDIVLPQLPGAEQYAYEVAAELEMMPKLKDMVKRMYKATYEAVAPKTRAMKIGLNTNVIWCGHVKAIYKAFKGEVNVAGYGKAALVGFAIDLLMDRTKDNTLVSALKRSPDPAKLIRYLV